MECFFLDNMELFKALDENDIEKMRQLLDSGVDIETKKTYGYTVLLVASYSGNLDMVQLLVERGANVNNPNDYGWNPLMTAANFNRMKVLVYLLEHGADIKKLNNDGNTALGNTMRFYKTKKEICDYLLQYKHEDTDINCHNAILATIKGEKRKLEELLNSGVSVNSKNYDNVSLLHIAAFYNRTEIMQTLLQRGAEVNAKASFGETSLLCSAYRNSLDCFKLLLAYKADIAIGNNVKFTPLMSAACHNYIEMTKILLSKGASIETKTDSGYTALLHCAEYGAIDCADILLDNGANIFAMGNKGEQVLDRAADNKRTKMFLYFYNKGANFSYKTLEPVLHKIPRFLFVNGFESVLAQCNSPINVLNSLYKNDREGEHSSIISRLVSSFFKPFDNRILGFILVLLNSLSIAEKSNLLEQADLNEKVVQIEDFLAEFFRTESLDISDNMLDLLLPSIDKTAFHYYNLEISKLSWLDPLILLKTRKFEVLINDYRDLHRSHSIFSQCGILNYCLKNEIKSVFRHAQISSVVHEVYKTTLTPPSRRTIELGKNYEIVYFRNKSNNVFFSFMNSYLNEIISGCEITNISIIGELHSYQNLRYRPKNMIIFGKTFQLTLFVIIIHHHYSSSSLEAFSKFFTLLLVSIFALNRKMSNESNTLLLFTLAHVFCVALYEIGTLQDSNWNFKEYVSDGWNLLDWISSSLLIISIFLLISRLDSKTLSVNGVYVPNQLFVTSAIPLSLSLLQSLSLIKPIGELVIMIKEMIYDIASFFAIYAVCTFGFAIIVSTLIEGTLVDSLLYLYSATLGNFTLTGVDPYLELLIAVYMLSSAILLINLLIARMSTTYQRINDKALQEWSFVYATTVQNFILINEKSPLSILPAPLNMITTALSPLHNYFLKKEISLAGTITDAILLLFGEILSFFLIISVVMQRFHLVTAKLWRGRNYLMYFTLPIAIPIFLIVMTVVHYFVTLIDRSFLRVQRDGLIVGFEPHLRCDDDKSDNTSSNFGSSAVNPIFKNAAIKRIDSMATPCGETKKTVNIFTDDDIKRIIRILNIETDSNLLEKLYEMGHKNDIKIERLETSINEIKQILLQLKK